jgi:hypothetical protein
MARGRIKTDSGIVGDYDKMRDFINYLNELIKDLIRSRNEAFDALNKMNNTGYADETFDIFNEKFKKNAEYIDLLKQQLDASMKFYNEVADKTEGHLNNTYK